MRNKTHILVSGEQWKFETYYMGLDESIYHIDYGDATVYINEADNVFTTATLNKLATLASFEIMIKHVCKESDILKSIIGENETIINDIIKYIGPKLYDFLLHNDIHWFNKFDAPQQIMLSMLPWTIKTTKTVPKEVMKVFKNKNVRNKSNLDDLYGITIFESYTIWVRLKSILDNQMTFCHELYHALSKDPYSDVTSLTFLFGNNIILDELFTEAISKELQQFFYHNTFFIENFMTSSGFSIFSNEYLLNEYEKIKEAKDES